MSNDSPTGRADLPEPAFWVADEPKRHGMHPAYRSEQARMKYGGEGLWVGVYTAQQLGVYAAKQIAALASTPPMVEAPEDPYQERRNIERSQAQGARAAREALRASTPPVVEAPDRDSLSQLSRIYAESLFAGRSDQKTLDGAAACLVGLLTEWVPLDVMSGHWFDRIESGSYELTRMEDAWLGWQCRALAKKP
jgi:hypothetical protein